MRVLSIKVVNKSSLLLLVINIFLLLPIKGLLPGSLNLHQYVISGEIDGGSLMDNVDPYFQDFKGIVFLPMLSI